LELVVALDGASVGFGMGVVVAGIAVVVVAVGIEVVVAVGIEVDVAVGIASAWVG
jgi:hypothetical protein